MWKCHKRWLTRVGTAGVADQIPTVADAAADAVLKYVQVALR